MPALTVFISRALFFETQSHAIKHDYFMQHSSVDAHSSKYPRFLGTAQLGRPGRKEHAERSDTGRSPPNTGEEGSCKATVARGVLAFLGSVHKKPLASAVRLFGLVLALGYKLTFDSVQVRLIPRLVRSGLNLSLHCSPPLKTSPRLLPFNFCQATGWFWVSSHLFHFANSTEAFDQYVKIHRATTVS